MGLILVLTLLQAPPRDNAPVRTGSASISGRVTDKDSGRPLPRSVVSLSTADRSWHGQAQTDASGRYEFTQLPAGEYVLMATPGELRASHLPQMFGESGPRTPASFLRAPRIQLDEGQTLTQVDVALSRALAIEGTVVDGYGDPLSDIGVGADQADSAASDGFRRITTDERGVFRIYGLAPGGYRVCATPGRWMMAPGLEPSQDRFVRTCYPAALTDAEARPVVLTDSDVGAIEIRLQRNSTYAVSGTVLDASGFPADGARLAVNRVDGGTPSGLGVPVRDGQFVAKGLTPGEYVLLAAIGGPADPGDMRPPKRELERAHMRIRIDAADVSGVLLTLTRGAAVAGRVIFEATPSRAAGISG